ncbi:hypothetical protein OZX62_05260 [Bifidobacterium sp. ESL0690]|uniref:hypothetical protein n=1 Tax=Bifidobacterium sp. ESL0690 TaxID=2983214 RepID=UPI0023F6FBD3|nr:hypothetical protein [Bifidobacterium sp. ESL0690]WEV47668.1 hypothetical protein OZX62_05260 [Bifidobacterium sp. ESL0690]
MPWWGWIIVAFVMLAALVIGLVYAGIHAVRAAHSVSDTGKEIQNYLDAMQQSKSSSDTREKPLFTQPLSTAAHRYSLAQTEVERRRITRHNRHAERWSVWKRNRVPFTGNVPQGSNQAVSQSSNQQAFDGSVDENHSASAEQHPNTTHRNSAKTN